MKVFQNSDVDTLQSVLIGRWFMPEYFDSISNDNIREPLKRIAHETQEDIESIMKIFNDHGVRVLQVDHPYKRFEQSQLDYAPLAVRNSMHVFGDTLYRFNEYEYDEYILDTVQPEKYFDLYPLIVDDATVAKKNNPPYSRQKWNELSGPDWPTFQDYCTNNYTPKTDYIAEELKEFAESIEYDVGLQIPDGCNIILTDSHVYVDSHEYFNFTDVYKQHIVLDRTWVDINLKAGHTDGCFKFLNKNTVIGIRELVDCDLLGVTNLIELPKVNYQNTLVEWKSFKSQVNGKWWLPGEENNNQFTHFVEKYLSHLVGYVDETFFDVNVLPLDTQNVFVASDNDELHAMYNQHGINPIPVPWRHSLFHDNGLHCISLCLHRQ